VHGACPPLYGDLCPILFASRAPVAFYLAPFLLMAYPKPLRSCVAASEVPYPPQTGASYGLSSHRDRAWEFSPESDLQHRLGSPAAALGPQVHSGVTGPGFARWSQAATHS